MPVFKELGLGEQVSTNAQEQGFDAPSAMQRSVIPVIRRGGNAIVRASSGSGITAAYAMALVDRLHESTGDGARALVIVPTADRAERVAGTIARFAQGTDVRVAALTGAWARSNSANIIVASAEKILAAVEESQLQLEGFGAVIVDGAASIQKLNGETALGTLFSTLPREGQRVFISSELTESVRKLAEAHARKALYFPPRPAVETRTDTQPTVATLRYSVASDARKVDVIALMAQSAEKITVICRSAAIAQRAQRDLNARGFEVAALTYDGFDRAAAQGVVFGYDPPFSAEQITQGFKNGDCIVCKRSELPHLKSVAAEANIKLEAAAMPAYEADSLNAFRNEIRRAAKEEDLEAQMLVLEPLFAELSPEEVAAAAAALLRSKKPTAAEPSAGARAGVKTWARLFLSIGERDGIRPGDIVGAITGESGINGEDVGRVDIRDSFSVIEVESAAAEKVIKALNGTTMKNRALRVDYDRKTVPDRERSSGPRSSGSGPKSSGGSSGRGGPSRSGGGPSRGGPSRSGGGPSRGGPSRGGPSRGGPSRGGPGKGGKGGSRPGGNDRAAR
ncbi:MAG TPA: DEAD/DEAH box helicase [Longimicrobiales bacterium]|nr:DEAD/DEAH box helicase [Longimicrobiales bacterium]